jgi:hypothetical protein
MMDGKLSGLMMCLMLGSIELGQASNPQSESMAAFLGKQTFFPLTWEPFQGEPDAFQEPLIRNASGVALPRMSLTALYPSASSSHPISMASFMYAQDPSTDMVNRLIAKTGLDRDDRVKRPDSSRSSPDLPLDGPHAQRFNLQPVDVEAVGQAPAVLPANEPTSSAASWASSVSHTHQASIQSLYNDMDDESNMQRRPDQWGEFEEGAGAAELLRGLRNAAPKEMVKVLHQDAVSKRPVPAQKHLPSSTHLRKTTQKYSPDAESTGLEDSTPVAASSLPKLYLHHGKRGAPQAEQQADHLRVNADDMVTYHPSENVPPENPSSLASSLRAHVQAEKTKELQKKMAEQAERKRQQPVVNVTKPVKAEEESKNSPMNTIHRHPSKKLKFKVQPEDIHYETTTTVTTTTTVSTTTTTQKREVSVGSDNTVQSEWDLLFNTNAVDGHLDAAGVEEVLRKMTNIKNPDTWNWRRFDLDQDSKLSRREFMNAKQIAMRFSKKK